MCSHASSHLIYVTFNESLLDQPCKNIERLIQNYINSVIQDPRINFINELEKRFIVNIVKKFDKETKTYVNCFAYVWCSKEVHDILMRRKYIRICDIPAKVLEEQRSRSWADYDENEEIDYNELLLSMTRRDKTFLSDSEMAERMKKYLEEAEKKSVRLGELPQQECFTLSNAICKCSMGGGSNILKMTNYLEKGIEAVLSKKTLIDMVENYINHVRLYNKSTLRHEYPKITRNIKCFEVEFPKEEICFAQKFFLKVIVEQGKYIGMFDYK